MIVPASRAPNTDSLLENGVPLESFGDNQNGMSELETGQSGTQVDQQRRGCRLFPIKFCCCPCLSSNWTVIQDWLHLVLVLGVLASVGCLVSMVVELVVREKCASFICVNRWLAAVCVFPSLFWFIGTIRHYDQELKTKKRTREEMVAKLIEKHNEQVETMNEVCGNITENANHFAEGRFNDKAAAFIRFLRNVPRDVEVYSDEEMVEELRKFVTMWFKTFSGTLISSESNPVWAGVEEDMQNCRTVGELCEAGIERVNRYKIAFKFQVPAEAPLIQERDDRGNDVENQRKCGATWLRFYCCKKARRLLHDRPVTYAEMCDANPDLDSCGARRTAWRSLRHVTGCGCQRSPTENGMPFEFLFCCGKLRVLSGTHVKFMFNFFLDIGLLVFEAYNLRFVTFGLVFANWLCATSVLACFEQINDIAILEREITFFKERVVEVTAKNEKANKVWEQVKLMHELWKYRTLPTLGVMHRVTNHLEDRVAHKRSGQAVQDTFDNPQEFLRFANQSIECLDQKLGSLESWQSRTEPMMEEWKDTVGAQLTNIENTNEDVMSTLSKLPIIDKLHQLDAPPPSQGALSQGALQDGGRRSLNVPRRSLDSTAARKGSPVPPPGARAPVLSPRQTAAPPTKRSSYSGTGTGTGSFTRNDSFTDYPGAASFTSGAGRTGSPQPGDRRSRSSSFT